MLPSDNQDKGHLFLKTGIGLSQIHDNKKNYLRGSCPILSYSGHWISSFAQQEIKNANWQYLPIR